MNIIPAYTKCPKCNTLYAYSDVIPESTSGDELWSDGFSFSSQKKDIVDFAKCPTCSTYFWLQENSIPRPKEISEIKSVDNYFIVDSVGDADLEHIRLASKLAKTTEKEIYLRTKLWHLINHVVRKHDTAGFFEKIKFKFFDSSEHKESQKFYNSLSSLKMSNLIRLSNLIKADKKESSNYIMLAEIYRELGDFSKAMFFCHRAETSQNVSERIASLKHHIANKNKTAYKL